MTNYTRARARRYASGGGSYVRLNTALGAGRPDCALLCALPAPTGAPAPAGALHFRRRSLRVLIPLGSPPRPSIHSCTESGRTRAISAPSCADLDVVPGISIPGVVGGVAGCLLAIAGAVILYKTWRASVVKRGDQKPLLYV